MLGIIPRPLKKLIREIIEKYSKKKEYRKKGTAKLVDKIVKLIHLTIIKNITKLWKERNREWERKINKEKEAEKKRREEERGRDQAEELLRQAHSPNSDQGGEENNRVAQANVQVNTNMKTTVNQEE